MSLNEIPVSVVGPGSQDGGEEALSYMRMPSGMSTYVRPLTPEPDEVLKLAGACEAMAWLRRALGKSDSGRSARANLSPLDAESRDIVNQILGEGEVSITYNGAFEARIQESVLAGVWRTFCLDGDDVVADILEVTDVPQLVLSGEGRTRPVDTSADGVPAEMTNALSILVELEAQLEKFAADGSPGIVNLSLLPLSDEEVEFLDERLGRGPVDILSRAYGKCQVISTLSANVWWVRYYNSMNTLILNTIEVTKVPAVVGAAPEDLRDSAERLEDILRPYDLDAR
jgi:hydrogenase-1 operon protein HyaF